MKTFKKIILFLIALIFCLVLSSGICNAATRTVGTEQDLRNAINDSVDGDVIELSNDITLTSPIEVTGKSITIMGNGHTITRIDTNWTPNGSNGTLITAGGDGTRLTLVNMTLTGSQKYGAQSYNGAYLVLDSVNISGNGFGGVLVNAGTLEIKNVVLGRNGNPSNNGIEIAKGSGVIGDNKPILIMNGRLSSSETENVIYLAENDNLITFEVRNTDSTTNKVFVQGQKVVVTDENNNIIYQSNENPNITVTGSEYVEPTPVEPEPENPPAEDPSNHEDPKPQEKPNPTPKTGVENHLGLAVALLLVAIFGIAYINMTNKYN